MILDAISIPFLLHVYIILKKNILIYLGLSSFIIEYNNILY